MRQQHRDIAGLNRRYGRRFRLLKGIEANVLTDGSLDLTPDDVRRLDIVVAAPHAGLRLQTDQTARMLAAVRTPGVHILGHPRGRKFGARRGIVAEWDVVFAEAATHRVAIEIDGDPARQDIDFAMAADALSAGCLFALDSDAHSAAELGYVETAIAHARLAGIPAGRIVNCWKLERLLDWAEERRARQNQ
jgi:histidinol phosphatase-like PHP family hydrolase